MDDQDLDAKVDMLLRIVEEQQRQIDELRAERAPAMLVPHDAPPSAERATAGATDSRVDRRLLFRGGGLAAGALAGGLAATVLSASPAAAAQGAFNGNPALTATGQGGNGVTATTDTQNSAALRGTTSAANANGVYASSPTTAINAQGGSTGILAFGTSFGVYGTSNSGHAVEASTSAGIGVAASAATGKGVLGISNSNEGVNGQSTSGVGVHGTSAGSVAGVLGDSTNGPGVQGTGTADAQPGVLGTHTTQNGVGVKGQADGANGVGVLGSSSSFNGTGVHATGGTGVRADGTFGSGIVASSSSAYSGAFSSDRGLFLTPQGPPGPSRTSTLNAAGTLVMDTNNDLWMCVGPNPVPGTYAGQWLKLAGPASAGQFHVLGNSKRVYDSRPGQVPLGGVKGILTNTSRLVDATNNNSGVPPGATAILANFAVTNTNSGGFGTLYPAGSFSPATANVNWSFANQTISNSAITAVNLVGQFNCQITGTADVIIDVIGYYR